MNAKNIFKGKNARYWLIGSVVVIVALFLLLRFNSASASDAAIDMTAEVTSVNVAETVNASGSLEAQPFASLIWETGGVVEEVYVKAGDHVKAGGCADEAEDEQRSCQCDLCPGRPCYRTKGFG